MAESAPPATFRSPVRAALSGRPGQAFPRTLFCGVVHDAFFADAQKQSRRKSIVTTSKIKQWVLTALALLCLPVLLNPVMSATTTFRIPAEDGAALFGQKCALCHGKDGKGLAQWRAKGQPDFTDAHFQSSVTDQEISDVIHNGKGKFMPAFKGKLTDEQITALVAQVRAFGKK